jgi:hypothetical protein
VRDADGREVSPDFAERLPYALSLRAPVYTASGALPWRLDLPAVSIFRETNRDSASATLHMRLNAGNTALDDRGDLPLNTRVDDSFDGRPVIYTLGVAPDQLFTLHFGWTTYTPETYFINGARDPADQVSLWANEPAVYHWLMQLRGAPPFTYYLNGSGSYKIQLDTGDTLARNERGVLAPGESLSVTVPLVDAALDYITQDVPPTLVTLSWGATQMEFSVRDGAGARILPRNDMWSTGYAVLDLTSATPPFQLLLDDARYAGQTFTFTLAQGETPPAP